VRSIKNEDDEASEASEDDEAYNEESPEEPV
jgi:hypothetical protein